jgi:peptidyl-prolyl cis-trans isomerase A (cyclophilin A)
MSKKNNLIFKSLLACSLAFSSVSDATIVEFVTSQGNIQVNLFDQTTPKTVDNFLQYIDESHYNDSVIHRVEPGFVVQGGGFEFSGNWPLTELTPHASIINEPIYSNVKGTIAMAKRGNDENSATNQWFFNLKDNSQNLDVQNGGFTVFGQVISGMDVIEKIAQLSLCNNDNLSGIPIVKESTQTCADLVAPGIENFVVIENITIIDSSEATDANLTPAKNTLINANPPAPEESSGGSLGWLALLTIGLSASYRRRVKK